MNRIKIVADSCCDLNPEQIAKHDISILPLYVALGDTFYRDGVDVTPSDIYAYFEQTAQTPKTSAANAADFADFFKPFAEEGCDIIYIGIGLGFSCTVTNSRLAAEEFENVRIACIDSKNLSTGIGLLVLRAAELREEGKSFDEIVAEIEVLTDYSRASFILERLEYLHRGGRCSLLAAVGASMLSIKPEIAVRNGAMGNRSKFRGSMVSCARKYVDSLLANRDQIDPRRAFVTYTCETDPEIVAAVRETAEAAGLFEEIVESNAGSVITSHCGRNTIGLLFLDKLPQ
ncbi:MAG: DegV family protein [Clostridia bacterium]|nr:DegV family protein [Clostridia bacterium]